MYQRKPREEKWIKEKSQSSRQSVAEESRESQKK
jgi:hypothetical protein